MPTRLKRSARLCRVCLPALLLVGLALPDIGLASSYATQNYRARLLVASGVSNDVPHWSDLLNRWGQELRNAPAVTETERAEAIHDLIHKRILAGKYRASASHLGEALSGGPFNCAVTTALFLDLAAQCGLQARAVSVPGHVWCRVDTETGPLNIETTCAEWFAILRRSRGLPDEQVSPAMARHRHRQASARELDERQLLAVFHFNQGVTRWRAQDFSGAAWANTRALCLDPACRVAWENLLAALSAACQ